MSVRIPWSMYDPILETTYYFSVNPNEDTGSHTIGNSSAYQVKAALRQNTSGLGVVDTLIFQNYVEQGQFSYSGLVYDKTQFDTMVEWSSKDYPVHLTDDLGRTFEVYITGFECSRVRARKTIYKHRYTFTGLVLSTIGI